jgi:hypothetical protein
MDTFIEILVMLFFVLTGFMLFYVVSAWILQTLKNLLNPKLKTHVSSYGYHGPHRSFMSYSAEELADKKIAVNMIYNAKMALYIFVLTIVMMFVSSIFAYLAS